MPTLPGLFRDHFRHEEHLYGWLLNRLADDLDASGPMAEICRDHLDASRAEAVQLRLLAALHRIVLRGGAPELERFYPNLGGDDGYVDAWPLFEEAIAAHVDELRAGLEVAPQTNEVGRSVCLLVGIFEAVHRTGLRRIRLLEPGASAGLNLLVDRYRFRGEDWAYGPADSPLTIDTESAGVRPVPFEVVTRRGCDLAPIDVSTAAGREYLASFVWPHQVNRHARLAGALQVAAGDPPGVDVGSADTWLKEQLAEPTKGDVLTVVWQSITEQYWPVDVAAGVRAAIAEARSRLPVAHVSMEGVPPVQTASGWDIRSDGPALRLDGAMLARSSHHGPPLILT
ncbi:MAG: DUF2332 domain-containing protein [Pseudonocardiaceae bacterium]